MELEKGLQITWIIIYRTTEILLLREEKSGHDFTMWLLSLLISMNFSNFTSGVCVSRFYVQNNILLRNYLMWNDFIH